MLNTRDSHVIVTLLLGLWRFVEAGNQLSIRNSVWQFLFPKEWVVISALKIFHSNRSMVVIGLYILNNGVPHTFTSCFSLFLFDSWFKRICPWVIFNNNKHTQRILDFSSSLPVKNSRQSRLFRKSLFFN